MINTEIANSKENESYFKEIDKIENPWASTIDELVDKVRVDRKKGLNKTQVERRLKFFGYNELRKTKKKSPWVILYSQFKSILVVLLIAAVVFSFIFGDIIEGSSILVVIIINTMIGFITEFRAIRSMEALYELTKIDAKVVREGEMLDIMASKVVPGDIIVFDAGDVVSADVRIIKSSKLKVNESALTGESVPVNKVKDKIDESTPLAERKNMLYNGTVIVRGTAKGIVINTGMDTELGKISKMVEEAKVDEVTPLEKKLKSLGRNLIWVLLAIIIIVAISNFIMGENFILVIETAIALAVATVPEGLPIIATIVLARGMQRMAKRNALINRLSAVETLGATNVICTDKTGTITENKMTATRIYTYNNTFRVTGKGLETEGEFLIDDKSIEISNYKVLKKIIEIGILCNNASRIKNNDNYIGDPLEVALLILGRKAGFKKKDILEKLPEAKEISFDASIKLMGTFHEKNDKYLFAVKGAVESVIARCKSIYMDEIEPISEKIKSEILEHNDQMAKNGLRVIGLAMKKTETIDEDPYNNLIFLGLVGLLDPPREGIDNVIDTFHNAGIRIIMATGDHQLTAKNIAGQVGIIKSEDEKILKGSELKDLSDLNDGELEKLVNTSVFARVEPSQKLDLIDIHQKRGSIVGMTGDGVNDAPALKKANIGIAMGQRGTQAAKEAADMILQDDNFSTLITAVKQGRVIFNNIRTFIIYLLSCNLSEILTIFFASIFTLPIPILPLQILYLNVITDIFPAFALGANKGATNIMEKSPRDPKENVITRKHWIKISLYSLIIALSVFGSYIIALFIFNLNQSSAVTISFLTLGFSQTFHVFNMRKKNSKFFKNQITTNYFVWIAVSICFLTLLLTVFLPGLSFVLKTTNPGLIGFLIVAVMSLLPLFIIQLLKRFFPNH
ncbi:MAG: HAD-IC family P-type ATPase [Candidatus Lokiarchaeota archaeon]|nr:HAD-IC family P-type ATPase [Candidatus Lokiarchaeota archaeon]